MITRRAGQTTNGADDGAVDPALKLVALPQSGTIQPPHDDLIDALGVAVYVTDAAGRITQYNEAAVELWGRRPELGKDLWCGSLSLYYPDGTPMAHEECPMAITLKENRPVRGAEAIAVRPDGTRVHFMPVPTPLRDSSGNLIGAVNVMVDITERRQAEAAQHASEERFARAFQASPAAMCIVRADDQRFIDVNEAFLKMLGYAKHELIGVEATTLDLWVDPKDRAMVVQALEKGAIRSKLVRLYTRSREIRHVVGSAEAVTLGTEAIVIILLYDITEQLEAEQAGRRLKMDLTRRLAEEQAVNQVAALLRTSLDLQTVCEGALSAAMSHTGTEFGMIAAKRGDRAGLVASLGLKQGYLKPYRRLDATTPSLLASALFNGRAAFSPKKRLPALTARMFQANGTNRFAVVPLVARGSVVGALQVASQHAGSWSREQRRFLARIADQAAMAVAGALQYEQLEQAFRSRDEGVRTIAHEVRTPLTAIKGFAQIAARQLEREDFKREQLQDSLEEIDRAAERLTKFAADMLSASSIEDSLNRIQREECQLGPFLRDAIREFKSQELTAEVRLQRVPRLKVQCDPQLIRQVLWNLLTNAVRYSPQGGEVVISVTKEEERAKICVSDAGPGVPPRERRRLFEKFYRGRTRDSEGDHQGLGLGLHLAQKVIEAHDGKIWYQPAEPQGATFCFSLPLNGRRKNDR